MSTPDRIVELWPQLSDETRRDLLERAEREAIKNAELELLPEEEALLDNALQDFARGRTLTADEFRAEMDSFMRDLRRTSQRQI